MQISSPCIRQCTLDPTGAFCTGCARTRGEIALWSQMDETARRAVMAQLPARRRRLRLPPGPGAQAG